MAATQPHPSFPSHFVIGSNGYNPTAGPSPFLYVKTSWRPTPETVALRGQLGSWRWGEENLGIFFFLQQHKCRVLKPNWRRRSRRIPGRLLVSPRVFFPCLWACVVQSACDLCCHALVPSVTIQNPLHERGRFNAFFHGAQSQRSAVRTCTSFRTLRLL